MVKKTHLLHGSLTLNYLGSLTSNILIKKTRENVKYNETLKFGRPKVTTSKKIYWLQYSTLIQIRTPLPYFSEIFRYRVLISTLFIH